MKKKKIAVIGGAGFIGISLCEYLIKKYEVFNIDLKKVNIKNVKNKIVNINNERHLTNALKKIDYVFHLAGISDLNRALDNPKRTANLNIIGTINILNACVKNKVKKIIFSSSLYSFTEEGGFYKSSKISAEFFIYEFFKKYDLKYTILRFGSIYGVNSNFENGLFKIMYSAIKKKKIIFKGSKEFIRKFINVKDVAYLTSRSLDKRYDNKILMITGNQSIKMSRVLGKIQKILNISKKNINIINEEMIGHYVRSPRKFNFPKTIYLRKKNQIKLDQGLEELKSYIKTNY